MAISWLFDINTYHWSTKAVTHNSTDYTAKIISDSFSGVTMRYDLGGHLIKPNKVEFEVSNPKGTLVRSDVEGYFCTIRKIVDGTETHTWKFKINRAVPYYGKLKCYCVDLLKEHLDGRWPNTRHPKEVWMSDDTDLESLDDYCVPVIFGTAYIPIMSVNTGADRYYVLGDDTSPIYTIDEVRTPHEIPADDVYGSASYSFNQFNDSDHKLAQFIIHDSTSDGSADANGLYHTGNGYYPLLVKYSRDDTASLTSPEEWIEYILEDMGIASADIDAGAGSTFEAAGTTLASRSITWNGGFWKKEDREKILVNLLRMIDGALIVTDKIELHLFSATSQETIDKSSVKKLTYSPAPLTQGENDGGRVHWPKADAPQDKLTGKTVVPLYALQASIIKPSSEVLEYRFDTTSANAQDAGVLHFAKKYLQKDRMGFQASHSKISSINTLRPSHVITLNDTIFGASFDLIITSLSHKKDNEIGIEGVRLEYLEDWADIGSSTLSITGDSSTGWRVAVIGGDGTLDEDVNWSRVNDDDDHKPEDNADVTSDHAGNLVDNPSFETGNLDGWTQIESGWSVKTGNAAVGTYAAEHNGAEGEGFLFNHPFPAEEGERFLVTSRIKAEATADGTLAIVILWYQSDDTYISATIVADTNAIPGTSYEWRRGLAVAPANTAYGLVRINRRNTPTTGTVYVDNVFCFFIPKDTDIDALEITNGPIEAGAVKYFGSLTDNGETFTITTGALDIDAINGVQVLSGGDIKIKDGGSIYFYDNSDVLAGEIRNYSAYGYVHLRGKAWVIRPEEYCHIKPSSFTTSLYIGGGSNLFPIVADTHMMPDTDDTYTMGSASHRWAEVHSAVLGGDEVQTDALDILTGSDITLKTPIIPDADNTYALGSATYGFGAFYANTVYMDYLSRNSAAHIIAKTPIIPDANDTYALGSATYRWGAIYANAYYAGTNQGITTTFTNGDGDTVTVTDGLITGIS